MRVICIGANIESKFVLERLLANGCKIEALITRPPKLPGSISDYVDLHELCKEYGIPTIDTLNVNTPETINTIDKFKPDYLFTLGWSQLFSTALIRLFPKGVIGSHPTKLPIGRGRAPVPWTVLQGLKRSAVSFFKMDEGIDSGDLILQLEFDIPKRPYAYDVYKLVAENLALGFCNIYERFKKGEELEAIKQDLSQATYTAKRTKLDGLIDFNNSIEQIDSLIRAVSYPYPGAYTFYDDTRISIYKSEPVKQDNYLGENGQILEIDSDRVRVKVREGSIWFSEMKFDDGSLVICESFFKLHDHFGYRLEEEIYRLKQIIKKIKV